MRTSSKGSVMISRSCSISPATVSSNTLQARGDSEVSVVVGHLEFQFAKNGRDLYAAL